MFILFVHVDAEELAIFFVHVDAEKFLGLQVFRHPFFSKDMFNNVMIQGNVMICYEN